MAWPNQSPPGSNSSTPQFTPPAIVALASGIIMFLASILGWITFEGFDGDVSLSAWSTEIGLFPVSLFVPLAGLVTAALVAARLFAKDSLPSDILGFSLLQIQTALAFFTLLLAIGYLIMDKGGADLGFGYWLNLLGSMGLMAAAVMEIMAAKNPSSSFGGGGGQPSYGAAPQQSYPPPGAQQYPQQPQGQQYPQQPQGQPYPPQQQPPRPQPQQQPRPPQQQQPGQGYPPPPPQQGGNWPQQ